MQFLAELWLPILVSAVAVFITSSILWMATPLHKKDYLPPPDETGITAVLKATPFPPGMYFMPWAGCDKGQMKDPAAQERMRQGPWALLMIPGGPPSFGRSLGLWMANLVVVSMVIAYVASVTLTMGLGAPEYLHIFRVVGSAGLLAHAGMAAQDTIWRGLGWRHTIVKLFDGVVYALVTAGVFGWLWPRG